MATTDTRSGFRLPWSTDRSASRETTAEPRGSSPTETGSDPEPGIASDVVDEPTTTQDATGDAVRSEQEGPVTILAPDTAPNHAYVGLAPADAPIDETPAAPDEPTAAVPFEPHSATVAPAAAAPARRPTKFLADLTRAMQAAAEQARAATIEQFNADGTAVIEEIHATSATTVGELRRRADEDVAGIKDWSKAEIARIREETEQRIGARREQLEGQLERHAALVEHEIEQRSRPARRLRAGDGPVLRRSRRRGGPGSLRGPRREPPGAAAVRRPVDEDAVAALLAEPGIGAPAAPEPAAAEPEVAVEAVEVAAVEAEVANEPVAADDVEDVPVAEAEPFNRESALAAIQAAAEAAADAEAGYAEAAEAEAAPAESLGGEPDAPTWAAPEAPGTDEVAGEAEPVTEAHEADQFSTELDPRLAMLGLDAGLRRRRRGGRRETAAAEVEDVPEIGGDALAARLSGLVPEEASPAGRGCRDDAGHRERPRQRRQHRQLQAPHGRLAGVGHVGVSSGPDGEFVFAVQHESATSLRDLIPTIPGFGARVTEPATAFVHVSAQDPRTDAARPAPGRSHDGTTRDRDRPAPRRARPVADALREADLDPIVVQRAGRPRRRSSTAGRHVALAILDGETDFDTSLEYYELLREAGRNIPALMVLSPLARSTAMACGQAGVRDEFFTRPYSPESIRWRVEAMIIRRLAVDDGSGAVIQTGPSSLDDWSRNGTLIAVFNPKGGVGKTTVAINVSAALARRWAGASSSSTPTR